MRRFQDCSLDRIPTAILGRPRLFRLWCRCHDFRDQHQDLAAEFFGFHRKPTPLIVRESQASASDMLQQDAIFLKQIFDDSMLPLVHPTGNRDDEKRKWIQSRSHRRRLSC